MAVAPACSAKSPRSPLINCIFGCLGTKRWFSIFGDRDVNGKGVINDRNQQTSPVYIMHIPYSLGSHLMV